MKKLVALVATITLASTSVVACTPKPVSAEPVAEEFLQGMESRNNDGLAALTDAPSDATSALDATYSGLQAEGSTLSLKAWTKMRTSPRRTTRSPGICPRIVP